MWRSWGIEPSIVIGHNLGEYVAACVAGVLPLEDALRLVAARGRLMQALPRDGGMCGVFAPEPRVVELIGSDASLVSVAAINEPGQTVISGERQALEAVVARARTAGYRSRALAVSHAFHSPLMAPMLDEFDAVLRTVTFSPPRLPIVSS